jgi:hypothetical protein
MKRIIVFISVMLLYMQLHAQKNINLIISIDREIAVGSITGSKLVAIKEDGSKTVIAADYYPGNLSISEDDYKLVMDPGIKTVYLSFNYTEHKKSGAVVYNYELDLKKGWLTHYFYLLYIYNTSKKEFRKLYNPPPGKDYVFEFDSPGGSTRLIRHRK